MIVIDSIRRSRLWPFNRVAQVTCKEHEQVSRTNYFGTHYYYLDAGDTAKIKIKGSFNYKAGDQINLLDFAKDNKKKLRLSITQPTSSPS